MTETQCEKGRVEPKLYASQDSKERVHLCPNSSFNNNNNNIQFLETHNTIKNSLYACEKSKYQTEIMIFQN